MKQPLSFQLPRSWLMMKMLFPGVVLVFSVVSLCVFLLCARVCVQPPPSGVVLLVFLVNGLALLLLAIDTYDYVKHRTFLVVTDEGLQIFGTFVSWSNVGSMTNDDPQLIPDGIKKFLVIKLLDPSLIKKTRVFISRAYQWQHHQIWLSGFCFEPSVDVVLSKIEKYRPTLTDVQQVAQEGLARRGEQFRDRDVWWIFILLLIITFLVLVLHPELKTASIAQRGIFFLVVTAFGGLFVFSRFQGRKK